MLKSDETVVKIDGRKIKLTNLNKIIFPDNITKRDLIKYYYDISDVLLPHITDRPLVLKRYPHGINGGFFYQKECPLHAPEWVKTFSVNHGSKKVNYIICDHPAVLIWLANLGCIEIHAWTSCKKHIENPNIAVMDLDPAEGIEFSEILKVSLLVRQALNQFGLRCYPKTSGSRGVHIFIPIEPKHTFAEVTSAMKYIAELIEGVYPAKCTTERTVKKRGQKIYLDYLQNTRGKTMSWQYSLRPKPGAPVSAPLTWEEIEAGDIAGSEYNIKTIFKRLKIYGDICAGVLSADQNLDVILQLAAKR